MAEVLGLEVTLRTSVESRMVLMEDLVAIHARDSRFSCCLILARPRAKSRLLLDRFATEMRDVHWSLFLYLTRTRRILESVFFGNVLLNVRA